MTFMLRRYGLLLIIVLMAGCASTVSSIKEDRDVNLEADAGYLLLGVDTNEGLQSIAIDGPEDIRLTSADLRSGTQYILIDLAAGDYRIEEIKLNRYWYIELEEGHWDFTIRPGGISYVGHVEVQTRSNFWLAQLSDDLKLANRSTEALVFMEEKFPSILKNRELRYDGPGTDPFLQQMQAKQEVAENE